MSERERVRAALARAPVDRVPFGEFLVEDGLVALLAGLGPEMPVSFATRCSVLASLGQDAVVGYPATIDGRPLLGVHLAAGQGTRHSGAGGPIGRWRLPAPDELDWRPFTRWLDESPFFTFAMLPGSFSELLYLLGTEELLSLTVREPGVARHLAEAMVDYGLALARTARDFGAEGFVVGDDVAWHRGLYLRPNTYRERFLPPLEREVESLRELGLPVVLHGDGNLSAVLEDWVALAPDGLHGLQSSAGMELAAVNGGRAVAPCLWGNLDLEVIAKAPPDELERSVREILVTERASPGFIFGSSAGELGVDLPADRVRDAFGIASAIARDTAGSPPAPDHLPA